MANFPLPNDEFQKNKIMGVVREISGSMTRIDAEREYIKEAVTELSKEHQIPKKHLNRFIKSYHRSDFATQVGTNEEFTELVLALQPKSIVDDFRQEGGDGDLDD